MDMSNVAAIVLAAGQGKRMGTSTAKQFLDLGGKPILYYSLRAFEKAKVGTVVLVTSEDAISYCQKEIVERYGISNVKAVVSGGKERYHSVYNGLQAVKQAEVVMIHDGARPFVTTDIIENSYKTAKEKGACVVGVPVKDTIKVVNDQGVAVQTPERSSLWQIQTPQSFIYEEICKAYEKMMNAEDTAITDDAMVMERYGERKVSIIEGNYCNIKITTPEDMLVAKAYLQQLEGRE